MMSLEVRRGRSGGKAGLGKAALPNPRLANNAPQSLAKAVQCGRGWRGLQLGWTLGLKLGLTLGQKLGLTRLKLGLTLGLKLVLKLGLKLGLTRGLTLE